MWWEGERDREREEEMIEEKKEREKTTLKREVVNVARRQSESLSPIHTSCSP